MDNAEEKQPKVGDVVSNKNDKYRIIEINKLLTKNEYVCKSMKTGDMHTFLFNQITLGSGVDFMDLTCDSDDNTEEEQIGMSDAENRSLPMDGTSTSINFAPDQEPAASRFANVDEHYLCDLESKRNEDSTNQQTKWAVGLFRSEYFLSNFVSIILTRRNEYANVKIAIVVPQGSACASACIKTTGITHELL